MFFVEFFSLSGAWKNVDMTMTCSRCDVMNCVFVLINSVLLNLSRVSQHQLLPCHVYLGRNVSVIRGSVLTGSATETRSVKVFVVSANLLCKGLNISALAL